VEFLTEEYFVQLDFIMLGKGLGIYRHRFSLHSGEVCLLTCITVTECRLYQNFW